MFTNKILEAPMALTFDDVILLPGYTEIEPSQADLKTMFTKNIVLNIPIVSSPMDTVTESKMAIELALNGCIGVLHRNCSREEEVEMAEKVKSYVFNPEEYPNAIVDDRGRLMVAAAVSPFDIKRAIELSRYVDALVVDVAHFHNKNVMEATKKIMEGVGVDLIVGNIGTYKAVEDILAKLEEPAALRVGIGSGSICITGEVTGVAAPTLFAVARVSDALVDYGARRIPVIADGGIRNPGDAVKALAAGASTVMLGYALAGTDEAPGKVVEVSGVIYKEYRGMGSRAAKMKRYSLDRYSKPSKAIDEGVEGLVPARGPVREVLSAWEASMKASLGYIGAKSIRELWEKAVFARISPQGRYEVKPHSIVVKRSP